MTHLLVSAGDLIGGDTAHTYLDRLETGLSQSNIGYSGIHTIREDVDAGRSFFAPFDMILEVED